MSFLAGLMKVAGWVTGNSFSANLAKTAIIGYTVYRLNRNLNKGNDPKATIDEGVRLQINPSAENRIPVVYGSSFLGGIITDAEMSGGNKTMHFCITISEKTGTVFSTGADSAVTFREVFWNDQRIVFKSDGVTADFTQDRQGVIDRSLEGRVKVYFFDGGSDQPRPLQGFGASGLEDAYDIMPGWGSATHQMNDLVFAVVRVDYDRDRGVTSLGNVKFHIQNSMTRPGDCLYDYFTNSIYGAGLDVTEVDTATLTALNAYSDENVVYTDEILGANQVLAARYRINGVLDTEKSVLENIEDLASSAGSWVSYDVQKGQWSIVINRAGTAVAAFDDSTIIGNISVNGTGVEDLYNRVKAEFPNRDIRDAADFITIALPEEDRNANEYENTLNIVYDLINEPVQAEILGFIELKQSRVDLVIRFTTDYSYTILTSGDVISVTNQRIGWTNKLFRIIAVNEKQDDDGRLLVDITALEYDASVYSVLDIFRFARTDQNGIIGIGAIGVPGTPIVNKIEIDSRPRILVSSISPTGIVEAMEFWRTTDVTSSESERTYTLIGTVVNEGGGTFDIGSTVNFEYDSQGAGNFLIKTRGVNSVTTGPFSEPSGIIEFQPQQTTDVIGPNTALFGLLGALGALQLLLLLNDLFGEKSGEGSIFDKIFKIFKKETGVDLVGDAQDGNLVVASEIEISNDGNTITPSVSDIDFVGPLRADSTGTNEIEVKIQDGVANKDILAWNAATSKWELISGCITCDFPPPPPEVIPCSLTVSGLLPQSIGSTDVCVADVDIPYVGSYFIKFDINSGTGPEIPLYAPLQKGSGNVYLYGTDGVLEQTLTESQIIINNNVVELPFANRQPGKDYFILIEEGLVTSCGCENKAIATSGVWEFRTSLKPIAQYDGITADELAGVDVDPESFSKKLTPVSAGPIGPNRCVVGNSLFVVYSEPVKAGTGSIRVIINETQQVVTELPISAATITGARVEWANLTGLAPNTIYTVQAPEGLVLSDRQAVTICDASVVPDVPELSSELGTFGFSTTVDLAFESFETCRETSGATAVNSNIAITFNKPITINEDSPRWLIIYDEGESIFQRIDLRGTFENRKYGDLIDLSSDQRTLLVKPTAVFKPGTTYFVFIEGGAIRDANCNVDFEGLINPGLVRFSTEGIETEPIEGPTLSSVFIDSKFGRAVYPGPGKLNIIDADTGQFYTQISSTHPAVTLSESPIV